jgi:hypothetical protein
MRGEGFEKRVARHFEGEGFKTALTPKTKDRGIDVIGEKDGLRVAIQAKDYSKQNRVGSPTVQKTSGLLSRSDIDHVIIVTTSAFTSEARAVAENRGIELLCMEQSARDSSGSSQTSNSRDEHADALGKNVSAHLLGSVLIQATADSELTLNGRSFSGVGVGLRLRPFDVADHIWFSINDTDQVEITADNMEYSPIQISEAPLANRWQTHDPNLRTHVGPRNLDIDIKIDNSCRYLFVVDVDSLEDMQSLEISRYQLEIDLGATELRYSDLPADLVRSLESARGVTIHR